MQEYLAEFRQSLGLARSHKDVTFVSVNRDSHVLEVPEQHASKVPDEFHAMTAKKGCKRYSSDALQALVERRKAALDAVELAQNDILTNLCAKFAEQKLMWLQVCRAAMLALAASALK